jgi:SOS response regulatory protein OraA/RecX
MNISFVQEETYPRRTSIFVDGEERRKICDSIIRLRELESIQHEDRFFELLYDLEVRGAMRYALYCLARQALHSKKLEKSLQRRSVAAKVIAAVVDSCRKNGYLNDEEWISQKVKKWQSQGKSVADIRARLRREGVGKGELLIDDSASLERIITRRYPQLLDEHTPFKDRIRVFQALQRRGFSPQIVKEFLQNKSVNCIMESEET